MVGIILCFSVVANMKMACAGGSSSVLRKALKAACDSMCTSSIIYTLYLPSCGANLTCSINPLISSTELFDAASNSCMLSERPSLKLLHDSHWLQASVSGPRFMQFMVLANIRAQLVLPTPRCPQNKNVCAK